LTDAGILVVLVQALGSSLVLGLMTFADRRGAIGEVTGMVLFPSEVTGMVLFAELEDETRDETLTD
jgi:hypothetical protein